jgi:hypothetical protein
MSVYIHHDRSTDAGLDPGYQHVAVVFYKHDVRQSRSDHKGQKGNKDYRGTGLELSCEFKSESTPFLAIGALYSGVDFQW